MAKFIVEMKLQGLELKIHGERADIPQMAANIGEQFAVSLRYVEHTDRLEENAVDGVAVGILFFVGTRGQYADAVFALADVAFQSFPCSEACDVRCGRALHSDEHRIVP